MKELKEFTVKFTLDQSRCTDSKAEGLVSSMLLNVPGVKAEIVGADYNQPKEEQVNEDWLSSGNWVYDIEDGEYYKVGGPAKEKDYVLEIKEPIDHSGTYQEAVRKDSLRPARVIPYKNFRTAPSELRLRAKEHIRGPELVVFRLAFQEDIHLFSSKRTEPSLIWVQVDYMDESQVNTVCSQFLFDNYTTLYGFPCGEFQHRGSDGCWKY